MNQSHDNIFLLLDQQGPFATVDTPLPSTLFSQDARRLAKIIGHGEMATKYRITRNQIFDFLNVTSFAEIRSILNNPAGWKELERRAYNLLGNMFGIKGTEKEIISTVNNYSRTADGVIRYLRHKVLANYSAHIEMTNEIDAISSPAKLLLINFDKRYHPKARFEAKRKLVLMNLAGSIDQRERETDIEQKFSKFLNFLNRHVWSTNTRIGELEIVYLLSEHEPKNFSCRSLKVISREEAETIEPARGRKLTLIKRRRFTTGNREIPIYVSIRKKTSEAKVLKLLRKGEENPAVAVDDELGLMGVLQSRQDIQTFQQHLTSSAIKANSFMALEDISDSLTGTSRRAKNIGSSASTPMLKFFARLGGMRVEFIVHTYESYLNYIYQKDVSHDEYEVKRIFDSGVAELLFPQDIYFLNMKKIRDRQLNWFRRQIEES
ncbi:MAG: hypothetical protein H8E79_09345 [Desulfobulbaceae bacterium]|uniref:Uncharacterized protein n=1 Tax=Candidatus Desulfatifera sulfidica TaxID=2841691 RepID=A0A8J6N970_9BACT|nr:hypothetical protein [Candidatus Desulfatifera sulfidica]